MPASTSPLVGRVEDLAALADSAAAARSGDGVGVLVLGDAGVGKTRLVTEAVAAARGAGDLVLVGHCIHLGASLPYLPVVDALRDLLRAEPDAAAVLERHPAALALVTPGSGRYAGAELYEDVLGVLLELAAERAVLLLVEDVHWADTSTRDLLGFLLTRLPRRRVTVWLTVRADDLHRRHPLRPSLAEWSRLPGVTRRTVAPLPDDELRRLLEGRHDGPLDLDLVDRICHRAGGNPFFAEQLLAAHEAGEALPVDLADLVLVSVEGLSEPAHRVVRSAAVHGRRVNDELIAVVTGLPPVELDAALRESLEARVLVSTDRGYAFRHALLAEAVYEDLLPGERVRLHTAFAAGLAGSGQDADLARHALESFDLPTAYAAAVRAAQQAQAMAAPAEALALYEQAGAVASQVPAADPVALAVATADAASLAGHPYRAVTVLDAALAAPDLADEHRAELMMWNAKHRVRLDLPGDPYALSAAALALLPEEPSPLRARALQVHAHVSLVFDHRTEALALASEALEMARTLGLPSVAADASATFARTSARLDPEAAERLLLEQAAAATDPTVELYAWHGIGGLRHEAGRVEAAIEAYALSTAAGERAGRPWAAFALDSRCLQLGLLVDAGRLREAAALLDPGSPTPLPGYAHAALDTFGLGVMVARGDDDRAWRALEASREWLRRDGLFAVHAAFAEVELAARRDGPAAAAAARDAAVRDIGSMWHPWFAAQIRIDTLLLGVLVPDQVSRAPALLAGVHHTVEQHLERTSHLGPEGLAWVARAEAEAAWLRWRADHERPSAEGLVAAWRTTVDAFGYGNRYEQVRSRLRLAEVLAATGDRAAARAEGLEVLAAVRTMGATPLIAPAKRIAGIREAATEAPAGLTPREREVLVLVADGRSNGQIGRQLFISDKTVSVHVSNLLAKLGAASRTEAAAFARRDGLLD